MVVTSVSDAYGGLSATTEVGKGAVVTEEPVRLKVSYNVGADDVTEVVDAAGVGRRRARKINRGESAVLPKEAMGSSNPE